MSAKGIGAASVTNDHYPTPPHVVQRLLEVCPVVRSAALGGHVLDPCAADGILLGAMRRVCPPDRLHAIELRPECEEPLRAMGLGSVAIRDALAAGRLDPDPELVITNPPFSLFDPLAKHYRRTRRVVAFLGRASWLFGAQSRAPLIRELGMPDVYGLPERPSFIRLEYRAEDNTLLTSGGTDSVGVAWYVWSGEPKNVGAISMLRVPRFEERNAYVPPTRILYVRRGEWRERGKHSEIVREDWVPPVVETPCSSIAPARAGEDETERWRRGA